MIYISTRYDGKTKTCTSTGDGYDGATYTLTITIETIQFDAYKEAWNTNYKIGSIPGTSLYDTVESYNGTLATEYTGNGSATYANKVYFMTGGTNNNVLFANFCWKIVRTTDTGGVKLIYNGKPTDGKCNNIDENTAIGNSAFNINDNLPAYVGYMYNTVYESNNEEANANSLYGNYVSYQNGVYTLKETSNTLDDYHHYTCNNETGECETVRYYYYVYSGYYGSNYDYIELNGTESVEVALNEMLSNDNVNTKDSTVKAYIDNWYEENMTDYTKYLEDTVFCNDRSISSLGGWNHDGGSLSEGLQFKGYDISLEDLICSNNTDKFTVSKSIGNGKLKYPIGLLSYSEAKMFTNTERENDIDYWLISPFCFNCEAEDGDKYALMRAVRYIGISYAGSLSNISDEYNVVRPSISLVPGIEYSSGDGTVDAPFVIITQ